MKKFHHKKILCLLVALPILLIPIIVSSCSNTMQSPSIKPPIVSPDTNPPMPPDSNIDNLTKSDLYSIKRPSTLNGDYIAVSDNHFNIKKDVHIVSKEKSNLPSLFVNNHQLFNNLIELKRNDFDIEFNIIDYSDAFRYSGNQNVFERYTTNIEGNISKIPHTNIDGRAKYKLTNVDENYNDLLDGFHENFNYSFIDVKIILNHKTQNKQYSFKETFLFQEGIGEVILGNEKFSNLGTYANSDQKKLLNWQQSNDFNSHEGEIYDLFVDKNSVHSIFNESILTQFVAIKHYLPKVFATEVDTIKFYTPRYEYFDLPNNLSYQPILKYTDNSSSSTNSPLSISSSKNSIFINAENINSLNSPNSTLRWHDFGKKGNIDYYYRGNISNLFNYKLTWIFSQSNYYFKI